MKRKCILFFTLFPSPSLSDGIQIKSAFFIFCHQLLVILSSVGLMSLFAVSYRCNIFAEVRDRTGMSDGERKNSFVKNPNLVPKGTL